MPHIKQETAEYVNQRFYKILYSLVSDQDKKINFKISSLCKVFLTVLSDSRYIHKERSLIFINLGFCFDHNKISSALASSMFFIVQRMEILKDSFKNFLKNKEILKNKDKKFSLSKGLDEINKVAKQELFFRSLVPTDKLVHFDLFINNFDYKRNELNTLYIIEKMTSGFKYQKEKNFFEMIDEKINNSETIKKDINNFIPQKLSAYVGTIKQDDDEWSNKIYLISIKTLSVLEAIKNAKDKFWARNVFIYEFYHWVSDIHLVLNKYDIEDDWEKIRDLVVQENSRVEWKSSFFTSTETKFIDEKKEKEMKKIIFSKIIKAMLGMINTDGGVILVGVVENPQKIVREDIRENLIKKNKIFFLDINYELIKKNKTVDDLKREIQDGLFNETAQTAEKFNDLWSISPIEIKENYKIATIFKIEVVPSKSLIFGLKKEDATTWINLTKRADGRTIQVDPRQYF